MNSWLKISFAPWSKQGSPVWTGDLLCRKNCLFCSNRTFFWTLVHSALPAGPQSARLRLRSILFNLNTAAGTALQHRGALQPDCLWGAASKTKSPAGIQLLLGRVEAVDCVSLAEPVAFGAVQYLGLGEALFIQNLSLLLLLCGPPQAALCHSLSLIPHPGQHEQHLWVRRLSWRKGPAHSLDQADGCSQNRQHRAQQVDLQQAPTRFLPQHLFGKRDQLLHALHVFCCSERAQRKVSRTSLQILKVSSLRTYS